MGEHKHAYTAGEIVAHDVIRRFQALGFFGPFLLLLIPSFPYLVSGKLLRGGTSLFECGKAADEERKEKLILTLGNYKSRLSALLCQWIPTANLKSQSRCAPEHVCFVQVPAGRAVLRVVLSLVLIR